MWKLHLILMKCMKIIYNILDKKENKQIVNDLINSYPELLKKNCHISLNDKFKYLDIYPNFNIDNIKSLICRYVISTNYKDKLNEYAGIHWHNDGDDDEISALLYLNGDNNKGGELQIKDKSLQFKINSMFIFNSSITHKVNPYYGNGTRIALKWRFKV